MSLVLIIAGCALVAVGVMLAVGNRATDRAGGSGLKSMSIEGPAWLVLVALGLASAGWGVVRWEDRNPPKEPEVVTTVPPTVPVGDPIIELFPTGFTFGDNNQLDRLWRACERGDMISCDDLFIESDEGSEYEWFGATCGGVTDGSEFCVEF